MVSSVPLSPLWFFPYYLQSFPYHHFLASLFSHQSFVAPLFQRSNLSGVYVNDRGCGQRHLATWSQVACPHHHSLGMPASYHDTDNHLFLQSGFPNSRAQGIQEFSHLVTCGDFKVAMSFDRSALSANFQDRLLVVFRMIS